METNTLPPLNQTLDYINSRIEESEEMKKSIDGEISAFYDVRAYVMNRIREIEIRNSVDNNKIVERVKQTE